MSRWILLRGLTREARHWGEFPRDLQAALPDAEIATIDLPGNGRLYQQRSPASVEAMADQCRAEARARGLEPPYRLLAMSLGGMVAVAWAQKYPEEVAGCVLINTSLRPYSPFHRRLRPGSYPVLLRLALPGSDRARETAILRLTSHRPVERAGVVAAWAAWRREQPVSTANAVRQLLAAARYRAPPGPPAAPLLILAGTADALVHPDCSRRLAQAWQADYAEHGSAGHDLPLDDGPWVADQVRRWLRGRTGR